MPLVYYAGSVLFQGFGFLAMEGMGFTRGETQSGLRYWHHPGTDPSQNPVLLLHGIGVGFSGYLLFMARLLYKGCGAMIVIEMPWIAMQTLEAPQYTTVAQEISHIVALYGYSGRVTLLAHSYGTFLVTVHHTESLTLSFS